MAEVSFGEWLKRRRGAEGWTQEQLAERIHYSTSAIRKLEYEERRPSAEVAEQLAQVFNIPRQEMDSFLRFARGDWQAFASGMGEILPWRRLNTDPNSNLPSPITAFIDREKEQREVINLVKKNRLVTLAGVGGIGKTRLAIHVGWQLLLEFPDGVWFAALDPLSDSLHVTHTVAAAFNIRESNNQPITETLKNVLRGKALLLILDNCEHVLDACADLTQSLLTHCPNLKILTTSREILNVEGEAIYNLPTLSTPEENVSWEKLVNYASVRLFLERAALVRTNFRLTRENSQSIAEICRRLDGIPLAIELTAARVNILNTEEISKQLQQSIALLASDHRMARPRHQTIQASLDWSWDLLSNVEQVFLRQLSVFSGGWTLEAAQSVIKEDALNLTNLLVQKSLIRMEHKEERETRYHFHEIVRHYAHEKLLEAGDSDDVRDRHLAYFVHLVEQAEPGLYQSDQLSWFNKLDCELSNFRLSLQWALASDVEAGLRIATVPWRFWQRRNYLQEVETWLGQLLNCYPKLNSLRVEALAIYSHYIYLRGNTVKAREIGEEALHLARVLGERPIEAVCLMFLARTVGCQGYYYQSTSLFEQSLMIYKSLGNKIGQATATGWMGFYHCDSEQSKTFLLEGLRLHRELGNYSDIAWCLNQLAREAMDRGDFSSPAVWLEEAKTSFHELGAQGDEGDVFTNLGVLAYQQCNYQQAHIYFQQALTLFEKSGVGDWAIWTQVLKGYAYWRQGHYAMAKEVFTISLQLFQKDGSIIGIVYTLEGIAGLLLNQEQSECAARLIGWTDFMREKLGGKRPPAKQGDVDETFTACLKKLGETAFFVAYEEGKKMSLEETVTYALTELQSEPLPHFKWAAIHHSS